MSFPTVQRPDRSLEELHTAEEELRAQNEALLAAKAQLESERLHNLDLFQRAPFGYLVTDGAAIIQEVNRAACELLHRPARFVRGKPLPIFVAENDRPKVRELIRRLVEIGPVKQQISITFHPSRGTAFNAEVVAEVARGYDGKVSAVRWVLVEGPPAILGDEGGWQRALLAQLASSAEEVVVVLDPRDRILFWNLGAELTFGYEAAEVVNRPSPIPIRSQVTGERQFQRKDGRSVALQVTTVPLTGSDGAPPGLLVRMRRVRTDRRQRPENTADKVSARFVGGVAHHLNNLTQVMLAAAEFARQDVGDGARLDKDLKDIQAAAARAVMVTRALVAYSGREVTWPKPIDLNALVWRTLTAITADIPESVRCHTLLDPGLSAVLVDPERIERVVRELLMHGLRAAGAEGTLVVQTTDLPALHPDLRENGADPPAYVQLAIHDSGPGLDEETKLHLFEPFFAIRSSNGPESLGLAAAWGLVHQAGGFIRVDSQPEAGTTLRVYLPVRPGAQPRDSHSSIEIDDERL